MSRLRGTEVGFKEKDDVLNTPKDPQNLTDLEKKHTPKIEIVKKCGLIPEGCTDAHVRIGEILHPSLEEHFIGHIDFYIDKQFIARTIIKPVKTNPAACVHLKTEGSEQLSVVGFCNLHGN